jgi:hypothetical protein
MIMDNFDYGTEWLEYIILTEDATESELKAVGLGIGDMDIIKKYLPCACLKSQ